MPQPNDLSRSLVALDQGSTLIAVIEMGQASWLIAAIVPGVNRHPLKKIATDEQQLLQVLRRWKKKAETAGRMIKRITVVYEAGRDGFWLARWLCSHGIETHVIHPSSVPVSREHRWAKSDRQNTELLKRAFLGWLHGEPDHCSITAIPRRRGEERLSRSDKDSPYDIEEPQAIDPLGGYSRDSARKDRVTRKAP
jgi:transposase